MGSEADPAAFAAAAAARELALPIRACSRQLMPQLVAAHVHAGSRRQRRPRLSVLSPIPRTFAAADIDSDRFPIVSAEALDMIVVPLVAFDHAAHAAGPSGNCGRYLPALSATCADVGITFDGNVSTAFPPTPTTCRCTSSALTAVCIACTMSVENLPL